MGNKRKERPCDSVPTDRRCRVCCNPRDKKPCQGPLPETSEAEPSRCCSSPISESTATTRSGRIIHEPTHLDQDADYVEQLGPLRDVSGHYCRSSSHVTKDAQIEALTAEVSELHAQATKLHDALRTLMATHTREMNEKEAQLKTINGKLIASERQAEKLCDKEIRRSQEARQKAFMSNYFVSAKASTSTMAMEAATSAPAVGYTVEQVRAQQRKGPELSARRPEHAPSDHRASGRTLSLTRTMKSVKRRRNCQRKRSIGLNRRRRRPSRGSWSPYPPKR